MTCREGLRKLQVVPVAALLATASSACATERSADDGSSWNGQPTTTLLSTTTTSLPPPAETTVSTGATEPDLAILQRGDHGDAVRSLQEQLLRQHYWLVLDGRFSEITEQAVFAFQKVNQLPTDGKVGPHTRAALATPRLFTPRSTGGLAWEVDKSRQLLSVVRNGAVEWIWNTSTGTERPYRHDGKRYVADTPTGQYSFDWQVDGWRNGALGRLYRPKYFHHDGIAVHGYRSVPPYSASHGCVRVTFAAMDFIWASGLAPIGASVLVYDETFRSGGIADPVHG